MPATTDAGPLTAAQIAVLRKIVTDGTFRQAFVTDPIKAVCDAGIKITPEELARLAGLSAAELEQLAQGVTQISQGTTAAGLVAGTNTLVYAIIVALVLAAKE
jgi:hypothetical protein